MAASVRFVLSISCVSAALCASVQLPGTGFPPAFMLPSLERGEARARDTVRTSMDGVYTAAQASQGKDVFAAQCQSCHTPTFHSGPVFRAKWYGRRLGELFGFIRREMPKNDPGSMSDEDYSLALAYLLRVNGMPTGAEPLAADSAELHRIRLDSVPAASSPPSSR